MSKVNTRTANQIADEAIDTIAFGKEHTRWLAALMTAIHTALEPDSGASIVESRISRVKDLASLGQYLADDCANYLERESTNLRRDLDQPEAAQ